MTRTTASRVLLVIDGLNSGGAQQQLVRMFLGMRSRDVDVHLVYYSPHHHFVPQIPEPERARVRCLTDDPDESKAAVLGLLRAEIGRVRPDVVVSFLRGAAMLVGLARLSGLHFRWIACERSSHLGKDAFVRRALYARSLRLADLVTTNSYTVLPELEAAGVPARRLRMIPNGMFVTAHDPAPREAPPPTRFLAVGNLTPDKNYVLLVKALVGLKARDWRLDHLGRNTEAPEVLAQVQHLVKEHGLEDRVHLHGRVSDVARWYGESHVLVHPSRIEGFPNVILEAWTYGCPVIVSDACDLPLVVDDGRTGLVAAVDDVEALRAALVTALDEPERMAELGLAGRREVLDRYTMDVVLDHWLEAIDDVGAGPGLLGRVGRRIGG